MKSYTITATSPKFKEPAFKITVFANSKNEAWNMVKPKILAAIKQLQAEIKIEEG